MEYVARAALVGGVFYGGTISSFFNLSSTLISRVVM